MISYIIPTRDRPLRLRRTLLAIESLGPHDAEIIVIDNASRERAILPALSSGVPVRMIRRETNEGAAARNVGAGEASSPWLIMLDDDSHPSNLDFLDVLRRVPREVAAISADIHLPRAGRREDGGLPEVFIGCGVALRRESFLALGGYDAAFNYYAEEYDLAARLLLSGSRVAFEPSFRVDHFKDPMHRDMNLICGRLVRNNGWVAQRYSPEGARPGQVREVRSRYRRIARAENALTGYARGLIELRRTIRAQRRTPMSPALFDRFTGLAAARAALDAQWRRARFTTAAIVDPGKNAWAVSAALAELGVRVVGEGDDAEALVIGTLSPGPMLDALRRRSVMRRGRGPRVIAPWIIPAPRLATQKAA